MDFRIRIILIVIFLLAIVFLFRQVHMKKIDFKYALGWSLVDLCLLVLCIWPVLLRKASDLLGIELPINMMFLFGFIFLIGIVYTLSKELSILSDKVKRLSQEIAILRKDTYDSVNLLKNNSEKESE